MSAEYWPEFIMAKVLREHPDLPAMEQSAHIAAALTKAGFQFVTGTPDGTNHLPYLEWPR